MRSRDPVWRIHRRDFLALSAGALAGFTAGTTRINAQASLRFGVVTDSHYADADPIGTRYYRQSLTKVREAVATIRRERASFLAVLGDIKDMAPNEAEARTLAHLAAIETEIRRFGGPTYHVLGNHDMDNISKTQMLAGITNTGIAADRSYYAFSHGGMRVIALDACYLESGEDYNRGNFDYRQTWIPAAELAWLQRELTEAREPAIILAHQRLDASGDLHVKNSPEVRAVLERSGKVLAVFMGHDHAGAYASVNGIHYYTQRAVVEGSGADHNAYTMVEVDAERNLTVTGYRSAVSKDLPRRQPAGER